MKNRLSEFEPFKVVEKAVLSMGLSRSLSEGVIIKEYQTCFYY